MSEPTKTLPILTRSRVDLAVASKVKTLINPYRQNNRTESNPNELRVGCWGKYAGAY
jgi:hypothetical protein